MFALSAWLVAAGTTLWHPFVRYTLLFGVPLALVAYVVLVFVRHLARPSAPSVRGQPKEVREPLFIRRQKEKPGACLAYWEGVIPDIARAIGADYKPGSFERFERDCEWQHQEWVLEGLDGCSLVIDVEAGEGYLCGHLDGEGERVAKAATILAAYEETEG